MTSLSLDVILWAESLQRGKIINDIKGTLRCAFGYDLLLCKQIKMHITFSRYATITIVLT
jgi:hypothetical protein